MSSTNRVFVSPGVYTSEKDISFVTRQVGVTTLGLIGETTKGPAFQPIFVQDYNQFKAFFGGLNATKIKNTGYAKYELPYIAKSYLAESNQLYVTRVLGLSGYDAGTSWSITTLGPDAGKVVVVLRSKATYVNEVLTFKVASGDLSMSSTTVTSGATNDFTLYGTIGVTGETFSYNVSLDRTAKNYITRVLGVDANGGKAPIYIEEIYLNTLTEGILLSGFTGLSTTLVVEAGFNNYKAEYSPATTPYVVSEINGSEIKKLFRFVTISDGNSANAEIKISIANIKPDVREFDVYIRAFSDTDANPIFLEKYSRCTMDPTSANFIGRRIGTLDGLYATNSDYVLVELDEDEDTSTSFPAGFTGVPKRVYSGGSQTQISYNKTYAQYDKTRKIYLGVSDTTGIDQDFFDYKGATVAVTSGMTDGFHMDVDASGSTLAGYTFQYGDSNFQTQAQVDVTTNSYNKLYARKFTFAPYGGFDGWDVFRDGRTNTDNFALGGIYDDILNNATETGIFKPRPLANGTDGTTSDYYAYLEAIKTFDNPEQTNINVMATPGIDIFNNTKLVEDTIEMVEQERSDSVYIVTTPDYENDEVLTTEDVINRLEDTGIDSSYTATYWPWVQIKDTENNVQIFIPPTRDVCRNIAYTDKIAFPWFAVAGIERGDVKAEKARVNLKLSQRDTLYAGRINPIITYAIEGIKIWGNRNLQMKESASDRLNVRRLLLQARKLVSAVSVRLVFEQDDNIVREQFTTLVNPILENIRKERGVYDFRIDVDNSPESLDRNELIGTIFIKPTKALEFIDIGFVITSTGASFDDV